MKLRLAPLLAALWLASGAQAGEPAHPMRIVSLNMCVDSIVVELVSHDRIAALSHYARDPRRNLVFTVESALADELKKAPADFQKKDQ